MRTDDSSPKTPAKKPRPGHEAWPGPQQTKSPPRSWTNKSMHHPATRIGEIKHGK